MLFPALLVFMGFLFGGTNAVSSRMGLLRNQLQNLADAAQQMANEYNNQYELSPDDEHGNHRKD